MDRRFLSAAALALALALPLPAASAPVMPGERSQASKSLKTPILRLDSSAAVFGVRLDPVGPEEIEAVRRRNSADAKGPRLAQPQRLTIGIARSLPAVPAQTGALAWSPVAGGHAARISVTSPQAGSLRLAIDLAGVPLDVEMVFFGSGAPARLEGPVRVGEIPDRTLPWWSPLTEGETQTVEFFVPARHDASRLAISAAAASHVFTAPSTGLAKRLQDIGLAGSCNVDVPCSPLASETAFRNAADSVAQMVFTDAGFTTLCTGTLLADGDPSSQVPWFYGANHCFENDDPPYKSPAQMQTVANTLTTLWGFEAGACNSRTPRTGWNQLGGGATFIHNNVTADVLFLRLNATPPAFAWYSGWDANPLAAGAALVSLHHPQGDLKKVTQGSVARFSTPGVAGGSASYVETRWTAGTTEQGSSGGGIWTKGGDQYHFRGGLWGGAAACTNMSGADYYSRFDVAYPALAPYLGAGAAPAIDYTDLWWNPNESGWGLNLTQHPSRAIFGTWYTYALDGKRTWFVMPGGTWTNATSYTGALYSTAGPGFDQPFKSSDVEIRQVGTATITFRDANNGTFTYSVDGVSGSKAITRQPF